MLDSLFRKHMQFSELFWWYASCYILLGMKTLFYRLKSLVAGSDK